MRRSGFTLLEVMVALVLTAVVALTAYGAARASAETRARLDAGLREIRTERALRQTMLDLLHNVRLPKRGGGEAFGYRNDTLTFVAAGVPPLDPEYDWRITLAPAAGRDGIELAATPLGRAAAAAVRFRVPGATGYEVQLLAPGGVSWLREWPSGPVAPRGVIIAFRNGEEPLGPPLRATLATLPAAAGGEPYDGHD